MSVASLVMAGFRAGTVWLNSLLDTVADVVRRSCARLGVTSYAPVGVCPSGLILRPASAIVRSVRNELARQNGTAYRMPLRPNFAAHRRSAIVIWPAKLEDSHPQCLA